MSSRFSQNPPLPLMFPFTDCPLTTCSLAVNPHLSLLYLEWSPVLRFKSSESPEASCLSYRNSSWIKSAFMALITVWLWFSLTLIFAECWQARTFLNEWGQPGDWEDPAVLWRTMEDLQASVQKQRQGGKRAVFTCIWLCKKREEF